MRALLAIVRREIHGYFASPIACTVIVVFLILSGFGFASSLRSYVNISSAAFASGDVTLQSRLVAPTAGWINLGVLLCLPALSMRAFSEERKSGTIELLMTSPVTTVQLVLGKYLGVVAIYALILVLTFPYLGFLAAKANPEWGAVATTYLGLFLNGAVLLAMGMLASALTENQIIAVVLTWAMFVPFSVVDVLVMFVNTGAGDVLAGLSLVVALDAMIKGLLDTHQLVLHGALIFAFLFLSSQVLESTRWR